MAADLRCTGWFRRQSLHFTDHELVVLEHETSSDLVRRFRYDRLVALVLWQTVPWDFIVFITIILPPPALLLLLYVDAPAAAAIGAVLLGVYAVVLLRYLIYKRTHIRLVRDGGERTYATIASPARMHRFRDTLVGYARYGSMG